MSYIIVKYCQLCRNEKTLWFTINTTVLPVMKIVSFHSCWQSSLNKVQFTQLPHTLSTQKSIFKKWKTFWFTTVLPVIQIVSGFKVQIQFNHILSKSFSIFPPFHRPRSIRVLLGGIEVQLFMINLWMSVWNLQLDMLCSQPH